MSKEVWVLLAKGFEEVEAITPIDYLRRVGAQLSIVGLEAGPVSGAHRVQIQTDCLLQDCYGDAKSLPDCIVLPGGLGGSNELAADKRVSQLILKMMEEKRIVAAICAAPALVLASLSVLSQRSWTSYPGFEEEVSDGKWQAGRVVVDENLITSRGPGCAEEFSLAIAQALYGTDARESLANSIIARHCTS